MRLEPYMCIGSDELANDLRTLTYLRRGLGGQRWDVGLTSPLIATAGCHDVTEDDVYETTYHSVYGGTLVTTCDQDGFTPQNLAGYCAAYDFSADQASLNYLSPASDPAPWYVAGRPDSGDFLGIVLTDTSTHPTLARSLDHGNRGASVGPARVGGQIVAVSGLMVAASACGMSYGERWVYDVLGRLCAGDVDLRFLPCCTDPPLWRTLPRVGLIDTPVFGAVNDAAECLVQTVAFQLASESPWMLSDPEVLADKVPLTSTTTQHYLVTTEAWPGDAGLRLVIDAGRTGVDGLVVTAAATLDGSCPPVSARGTCWTWGGSIPRGHRLIIDGNDHTVAVLNPATNEVIGGLDLLDYTPPFSYPEVAACSQVCISISATAAGHGSQVSLSRYDREL